MRVEHALAIGFGSMTLSVGYVLWKWGAWQALGRQASRAFWFVWMCVCLVWWAHTDR